MVSVAAIARVSPNRTSAADLLSGGGAPSSVVVGGGVRSLRPLVSKVEMEPATAPFPRAVLAGLGNSPIGGVDDVGELKHIFRSFD